MKQPVPERTGSEYKAAGGDDVCPPGRVTEFWRHRLCAWELGMERVCVCSFVEEQVWDRKTWEEMLCAALAEEGVAGSGLPELAHPSCLA